MKRRFAYFSPLPPAHTGIADYSRELIPHLAQFADLTLFSDQSAEASKSDFVGLPVLPPAAYASQRWRHDLAIYHIGNSRYHETIGRTLLRYPGIMVLHDYGLHQLWAGQTVAAGDSTRYAREMGYELGPRGLAWANDAVNGRRPLPHFEVALNARFVETALGVIVHSDYVRQFIQRRNPTQRVAVVRAPIASADAPSLRLQLDLPPDACLFGSFGVVSHTKQLEAALQAFRAVRENNPRCYYLIVGEWEPPDVDLPELVDQLGLGEAVRYTGYAPDLNHFLGWLTAVDVVISLRYPTVGETSAVALRALAAGRALVVYDHGWYGELPEDGCLKLPPLDQEALVKAMRRLAEEPALRGSLGQCGQAYVRANHTLEKAAAAYVEFAEQVLTGGGRSAA